MTNTSLATSPERANLGILACRELDLTDRLRAAWIWEYPTDVLPCFARTLVGRMLSVRFGSRWLDFADCVLSLSGMMI